MHSNKTTEMSEWITRGIVLVEQNSEFGIVWLTMKGLHVRTLDDDGGGEEHFTYYHKTTLPI